MYKPKTRKSRFIAVTIVVAALLAVAAGLYFDGAGEEARVRLSRQERLRLAREDSAALKIAVMPTLDCLPLYVARHHHLLDSLGADIRLKTFRAQMDCDTALAGGSVEGAMTDLVRAEWLQAEATPLTYLSATQLHWQLLAARQTRVKAIKQLFDKMVAMTRHSATDLLADMVVDSAGIKEERVFRIQVNDVGVRLDMMLNGEMDAAFMAEPQATAARMGKADVLLDTRKKDLRFGVLALRKAAADDASRKRQVDILRKAYDQACDSIAKHGVAYYAQLISEACHVRGEVASQLPADIKFPHLSVPRQKDIDMAKRWIEKRKTENTQWTERKS